MTCERCTDVCVRYAVRSPSELRKAIQIAAENLTDQTLIEVIPSTPCVSVPFIDLSKGAAWDDYVEYHFRCLHCNEAFWLCAETYHGSGGYREPKNTAAIRARIDN